MSGASGCIATVSPRSRGRSAGRSATTAPIARRIWRFWRCTPRCRRTAGCEPSGTRKPIMFALGSLAFAAPWLLTALAALPVIWWLLRVTPPAPRRVSFPAIRLLFGLTPREETPARTPWWLILLRTALAALVILALAHPVLNPQSRLAGTGPVVLIVDDGWAASRDWSRRQTAAIDI